MAYEEQQPKKLYMQIGVLVAVLSVILLVLIRQSGGTAGSTADIPKVDELHRSAGGTFFNETGLSEVRRRSDYKTPEIKSTSGNPFDNFRRR